MTDLCRSFPPSETPDARVLILGSRPGGESLRRQQYYAFPHNVFWRITGTLFHFPYDAPYGERLKKLREAGLVALALATALKLYPVVFAWMLLTEKRYREILRLVLYTAVLFIAPSFFFGGPVCFLWMAFNALLFFTLRSGVGGAILWDTITNSVVSVLFWIAVVGAPFVPYLFKKRWHVFAYFSVVLAAALPLQSVYGCMILWAPMWMGIFEEKTLTLKNARYFVPMGMLFVPLVNPWYGMKALHQVLLPVWLTILLCAYLTDLVIAALRYWREKRNPAPVSGPDAPEGEENNDTKTKGEDHE